MKQEEWLDKAVETIKGNEDKILTEFIISFLAHQSLNGIGIDEVFKKYKLCIEHVQNSHTLETKYHLEKIDRQSKDALHD